VSFVGNGRFIRGEGMGFGIPVSGQEVEHEGNGLARMDSCREGAKQYKFTLSLFRP